MKKKTLLLPGACFLALSLAGCGKANNEKLLDPEEPITLTVWHYYNGSQQAAFDSLLDEFNVTVGKERGIFVQGYSQGDVAGLESNVKASINEEVGSQKMPDIFSSYADTAYEVEREGRLANLSDYFSEEELDEYVDSYIEEGRIADDGGLRIFPVAKSTEIMMLNKTDWDVFAGETGASLDALSTMEGVAETAKEYYEWSDDRTPDVANDGKAFYGRDSMANYFIIGMRQLGKELFQVEDGKVTLNIGKEDIRRLWENYYVPYVKGYFAVYGKFRSDDVKTGDLLAFTGSTTASMYFPDSVELEDDSYPIDYQVLPAPALDGGEPYMVQQGAGMVVVKSNQAREYAAVTFLKWFAQGENNVRFGCSSGYLPVQKDAVTKEKLDRIIKEQKPEIPQKTYDCLTTAIEESSLQKMYTPKAFANGFDARQELEYNLSDKAAADREAVKTALAGGADLETACGPYLTEDAFDQWYEGFRNALTEFVKE